MGFVLWPPLFWVREDEGVERWTERSLEYGAERKAVSGHRALPAFGVETVYVYPKDFMVFFI